MKPADSITQTQNTIFRSMCNHIGQVRESQAQEEISRLNKQTKKVWRKDYSLYLEDDDVFYDQPIILAEGYCWIVTD